MRIRNLNFCAIMVLTMLSASLICAQQPAPSPECSFAIYSSRQVDRKVRILAKPEPEYDKEDRRRRASGVIILTSVFCGSGKVTDIKVKEGLSESLNERAVEAARKIQFIPAEKDGQKVSQVMFLEYSVNL